MTLSNITLQYLRQPSFCRSMTPNQRSAYLWCLVFPSKDPFAAFCPVLLHRFPLSVGNECINSRYKGSPGQVSIGFIKLVVTVSVFQCMICSKSTIFWALMRQDKFDISGNEASPRSSGRARMSPEGQSGCQGPFSSIFIIHLLSTHPKKKTWACLLQPPSDSLPQEITFPLSLRAEKAWSCCG